MRRGNQAAGTQRISFCVALGATERTGWVCVCVAAEEREKIAVCLCRYVARECLWKKKVNVCAQSHGGKTENGDVRESLKQ